MTTATYTQTLYLVSWSHPDAHGQVDQGTYYETREEADAALLECRDAHPDAYLASVTYQRID